MTSSQYKVTEADPNDLGRGVARLDQDTMIDLGVSPGDTVAIQGDETTAAKVWRAEETPGDGAAVRMDSYIRQNAGASLGDRVALRQTNPQPAEHILLAPTEGASTPATDNAAGMVKRELLKHPLVEGDVIPVTSYTDHSVGRAPGETNSLVAVETDPDGVLIVTEDTEVSFRRTPVGGGTEPGGEQTGREREEVDESEKNVTYDDIGGLDDEIERVREMVELPMRYPRLFKKLGIDPPKGVLLHGPPGTGKTLLAKAIANETDATFYSIAGPEIISRYYGESEQQLRETFENARESAPSVIFIDELDSIAPKREEVSGDVERRVVAQLLSLLDGLEERGEITVLGTTNRVDTIDEALRRPGRFDREIEIGVPDRGGREEILRIHTRGMPLGENVDVAELAENTQGFVGADLANLTKESAMHTLRAERPDVDPESGEFDGELGETIQVKKDAFQEALREIEPSALREVFVEVSDVTWDDVGGLDEAKERLRETVQWPLEYPETYEKASLETANGVLLYGPPGTGKTLLAKAVANEARSNFISIKGPELFDKYVGESEKGVREVFAKARENAPCVLFFDEIDAIAATRGQGMEDSNVGERVVSQLLTELDGLEELEDVVVVATTNRPDLIDEALLRPGRLDRHVQVAVPSAAERREIFKIHTADMPLADDVDLYELTAQTQGYVGVDIEVVCREAATVAVRERIKSRQAGRASGGDLAIGMEHFERALDEIDPNAGADEERFDWSMPSLETGTETESEP